MRSQASILLLPDGKVLVMGGFVEEQNNPTPINQWGFCSLTDLYDAENNSWRRLSDMNFAREYHAVPILIPDGRVVMMGGEGEPGTEPDFNVIEIFKPPYLFRGVRPEIRKLKVKNKKGKNVRYKKLKQAETTESGSIKNLKKVTIKRGGKLKFKVKYTKSITDVILMGTSSTTHFMDSGIARQNSLTFKKRGNKYIVKIPTDPIQLPLGFYILFVVVDDIPSEGYIVRIAE